MPLVKTSMQDRLLAANITLENALTDMMKQKSMQEKNCIIQRMRNSSSRKRNTVNNMPLAKHCKQSGILSVDSNPTHLIFRSDGSEGDGLIR